MHTANDDIFKNLMQDAKLDKRNTIANNRLRLNLLANFDTVIASYANQMAARTNNNTDATIAKVISHRAAESNFVDIYGSVNDALGNGAVFAAKNFDSVNSLAEIENHTDYLDFKFIHKDSLTKMITNRRNLEKGSVLDPRPSLTFMPALSRIDLHHVIDTWEALDDYSIMSSKKGDDAKEGEVQTEKLYPFLIKGNNKRVTKKEFDTRKQTIIETIRANLPIVSNRGNVMTLIEIATVIEGVLQKDEYIIPASARSILKESELLVLSMNLMTNVTDIKEGAHASNSLSMTLASIRGLTTTSHVNNFMTDYMVMMFGAWAADSINIWSSPVFDSSVKIKTSPMDRFILPLMVHPLFEAVNPYLKKIYKAYIPATPKLEFIELLKEIGKKGVAGSGESLERFETRFSAAIRADLRDLPVLIEQWRLNVENVSINEHITNSLDMNGYVLPSILERTKEANYRLVTDEHEFRSRPIVKVETNRRLLPFNGLKTGASGFNDAIILRSNARSGAAMKAIPFESTWTFFEMFNDMTEMAGTDYIRAFEFGRIFANLTEQAVKSLPTRASTAFGEARMLASELIGGTDLNVISDFEVASSYTDDRSLVLLNSLLELKEHSVIYVLGKEQFKIGLISGNQPINIDRAKHKALYELIGRQIHGEIFYKPNVVDKIVFDYTEKNAKYYKRMNAYDSGSSPLQPYALSEEFKRLIDNKFALKTISDKFNPKTLRDLDLYSLEIHRQAHHSLSSYIKTLSDYMKSTIRVDYPAFMLLAKVVRGEADEATRQAMNEPRNSRIILTIMSMIFSPLDNFSEANEYLALIYVDMFAREFAKIDEETGV